MHAPSTCALCTIRQQTAPEFITARPAVSLVKAYVPASTYTVR